MWSGKCPVGELSVRGNVRRGSVRRESVRREIVLGEVSVGELSAHPLFPLMTGTGMSVVWNAFFELSLFISSNVCSNETKLKINFGLLILEFLSLTQIILRWSLYFSMEAFILSARKFKVWSSKQGSFGIDFNSIAEILVESIYK